ncbi:DUF2141 domain-containing protein [Tianweitania sp. BSSL-BM11]|uniref:DUF2141 domain-containing protein n=1 Tax=Tianweitania aestuarii TaxID=2814886 RepID=A0ABS5RS99_9HYPH|nr:DUF2141 domain-containing protein [Tianweitania aestuarii]MBS9719192.1 DUF2141 domain-containing protein [Tianweitania aestuarii]
MTRSALFLGLALLFPFSAAQAGDLVVEVSGLRNAKGSLALCVTADPKGFPGCKKGDTQRVVPAAKARQPITFKNLPAGTYALAVIHDENNNGKLDQNLVGIPKEGIAVSNNAVPKFSAPKFKAAGFTVGKQRVTQTVRMAYW